MDKHLVVRMEILMVLQKALLMASLLGLNWVKEMVPTVQYLLLVKLKSMVQRMEPLKDSKMVP